MSSLLYLPSVLHAKTDVGDTLRSVRLTVLVLHFLFNCSADLTKRHCAFKLQVYGTAASSRILQQSTITPFLKILEEIVAIKANI